VSGVAGSGKIRGAQTVFSLAVHGVRLDIKVGIIIFLWEGAGVILPLDALSKPRREVYYRSIGSDLFHLRPSI
jgi:hypothetical protein